jgi:hypothetical protein
MMPTIQDLSDKPRGSLVPVRSHASAPLACLLVSLPSALAILTGLLLHAVAPLWTAVARGGALAWPWALAGPGAILCSAHLRFVHALIASVFSLLIRIGGVLCTVAILRNHGQLLAIIVSMTACLSLTLVMELLASIRFTPPRIDDQELARA